MSLDTWLFSQLRVKRIAQGKTCLCSCWKLKVAVFPQNRPGKTDCLTVRRRYQCYLPILCNSGSAWFLTAGTWPVFTSLCLSMGFIPVCSPAAGWLLWLSFPHLLWELGDMKQLQGFSGLQVQTLSSSLQWHPWQLLLHCCGCGHLCWGHPVIVNYK